MGEQGKAIPYGIYDTGANTGWGRIGVDHETAAFAVNTLRSWWNTVGGLAYPGAARLLITADSGGASVSNPLCVSRVSDSEVSGSGRSFAKEQTR